jgi:hypothetical protein
MDKTQKTKIIDPTKLKRGQIIARKCFELTDRISLTLGSPITDFIHYAIMAFPDEKRNDWLTFNARVGRAMTLEPLSRFQGQNVRIYSVKEGDSEFAYSEANRLLKTGAQYEGLFGLNYFFRILPALIAYWMRHGPRRVPWNEAPNVDSKDRINCLVLIRRCYPQLIPANCFASAFAFEQAHMDGKLILEQEGIIPTFTRLI